MYCYPTMSISIFSFRCTEATGSDFMHIKTSDLRQVPCASFQSPDAMVPELRVLEPQIGAGLSQVLRMHPELRRHAAKLRRSPVLDAVGLPSSRQSNQVPDLLQPQNGRSLQPKPPEPE